MMRRIVIWLADDLGLYNLRILSDNGILHRRVAHSSLENAIREFFPKGSKLIVSATYMKGAVQIKRISPMILQIEDVTINVCYGSIEQYLGESLGTLYVKRSARIKLSEDTRKEIDNNTIDPFSSSRIATRILKEGRVYMKHIYKLLCGDFGHTSGGGGAAVAEPPKEVNTHITQVIKEIDSTINDLTRARKKLESIQGLLN